MLVFNRDNINEHLYSTEMVDFIEGRCSPAEHFFNNLGNKLPSYADAMLVDVYHRMAWFLEEYPSVISVNPIWRPVIDGDDRNLIVMFRLEITSMEDGQKVEQEYGMGDAPASIDAHGDNAFTSLIEAAESIGPETWNEVYQTNIVARDKPYSADDIEDLFVDMAEDLGHIMPLLQGWVMERNTAPAQCPTPKPKRL